jgi:hypothetical protein
MPSASASTVCNAAAIARRVSSGRLNNASRIVARSGVPWSQSLKIASDFAPGFSKCGVFFEEFRRILGSYKSHRRYLPKLSVFASFSQDDTKVLGFQGFFRFLGMLAAAVLEQNPT